MPVPLNTEWLNANALRAYPFKEDSYLSPRSSEGATFTDVHVPNYVVVDFVLTINGTGEQRVYMSQMVLAGNFLTLVFSDQNAQLVTSITVNTGTHQKNQGYNLVGQNAYDDARGRVVFGDLTNLRTDLPEGAYAFELEAAELEPTVVRPDLRGIRSLEVGQNETFSPKIYGHVKLLAGNNVQLTYLPEYNAIRFDAIDGTGFNEECGCDPYIPPVISTINGIELKDLVIMGDGKCVDVQTIGNRIVISDKCSEPCCGCPELEYLTTRLETVEQILGRLETYADTIRGQLMNLTTRILVTV